jgi:CHAD domain-containing protein
VFRLELDLHPDDAPRLARLKPLASIRAGRARTAPAHLVWLDTPDAALAADGLAVLEQSGALRLERTRPNGVDWPVGAPAPVVADPADRADLPSPLMPWAALQGRSVLMALTGSQGPLSLTVLHGTMRSVQAERPACRLLIQGEETDVLALARGVAAELRAGLPCAALSAEAVAAARGLPPTARRLGPPALPPGLTVGEAFATVTTHLTDVMLYWCGRASPDAPEPVHQARVALRRLRSAFSIFRAAADGPALAQANAGLKALGRALGPARDWDVFTAGLGARLGEAFAEDPAMAKLLRAAEARRLSAYQALAAYLATPALRALALDCVALGAGTAWREALEPEQRERLAEPLSAYAAALLDRRHARLCTAGEAFDSLPPAALHDVRLIGKRLRYGCEFFAGLYPAKPARRFLRRLVRLQERLGVLNDAVVAAGLLAELPGSGAAHAGAIGVVRGYAAAGTEQMRPRLERAWRHFTEASPFWQ